MTTATASSNDQARRPLHVRIGAFFTQVGELLAVAQEAERLLGYSDAELARRGLRREDVVPWIFDNYFADPEASSGTRRSDR